MKIMHFHCYALVGGATRHTVVVVSFIHFVGQSVATMSHSSLKQATRVESILARI